MQCRFRNMALKHGELLYVLLGSPIKKENTLNIKWWTIMIGVVLPSITSAISPWRWHPLILSPGYPGLAPREGGSIPFSPTSRLPCQADSKACSKLVALVKNGAATSAEDGSWNEQVRSCNVSQKSRYNMI